MQAAVPKSQKLKLEPISSASIAVGDESTQSLRITAARGATVRLRLKMSYFKGGMEYGDMVDFNRFPSDLLA